ncbi:MAG: hypothetical protein C0620_10330, partial [Desulfuromonas sp.]
MRQKHIYNETKEALSEISQQGFFFNFKIYIEYVIKNKKRTHEAWVLFGKNSAATYFPTQSPMQYHRRDRA